MANVNFTNCIIGGRFCADPELKTTPSGVYVTSFIIAVNRRAREGAEQIADFYNCTAWRNNAEFITKFFRKGSSVILTGQLQNRKYKGSDGVERTVTELIVDKADFVDSKAEAPQAVVDNINAKQNSANMYELGPDEELPF